MSIGSHSPVASRCLALAVGLSLLAACNSKSTDPSSAPTIASAVFVGSGATPVAGDSLILFLSEDVNVVAGALLTDADLTLSAGTLGAVSAAPTKPSSRSVSVVLGAGVNLPSGTTIAFSENNDVIVDLQGTLAKGGTPTAITAGDSDAPTISAVTLSAVDGLLNGTGPAGGTLQVPQQGFTIDVTATDATSTINAAATVISANVSVNTAGGTVTAGANLVPSLGAASVSGDTQTFTVPSTMSFPEGAVTLSVFVTDITGRTSAESTFGFLSKALNDAIRPFETNVNAQQVWFVDLSRDVESFSVGAGVGPKSVTVTQGANAIADIEDLMTIVGLYGSNATINTAVLDAVKSRLGTELATLYAGVNISFTFTSPGAFPGQSTVPYNSLAWSQICLAGAEDPAGTSGVLGVAILDPNNGSQENDCLLDFAGVQRLGVFMHTAVNAGFQESSIQDFRMTYDGLRPDFPSGVPIGNDPDGMDAGRVAGTVTSGPRATLITNAINRFARMAAVIMAHECGHSMGLVINGAMPAGLYGGDPTNFPGSTDGHIRTATLFPSGSQNVMSPAIGFASAISTSTGFNSLNLAYLRERALYNN